MKEARTDTTDTNGHRDKSGHRSVEMAEKASVHARLGDSLTRLTPLTPQKRDTPEINANPDESLGLFRFDLVQADIDAGYPAVELRRANNLAWRLISGMGYPFDEAMAAAAQWVANNPAHPDEAACLDVMQLFKRIAQ
jgi:hypothetical protein